MGELVKNQINPVSTHKNRTNMHKAQEMTGKVVKTKLTLRANVRNTFITLAQR